MLRVHIHPLHFGQLPSMREKVEITRYPNRRLYDRSGKQYVTVGDIEAMILDGKDVRIRDSKSGEDLSRVVLIQIILERHPERVKLFPVPFLHAILRADQLALDWLTAYFGQATRFIDTGRAGASRGGGFDLWRSLLPQAAKAQAVADEGPPEDEQNQDLADAPEGHEMAIKLAELERRLQQLETGPGAPDEPSH